MVKASNLQLVRTWHDALNARAMEQLAETVSDDVEIGGPRGVAFGRGVLLDWVERSGIRMDPTDWYERGNTVIVCQQATWPDQDGTPGMPQKVATVFVVDNGRIVKIGRFPDLVEAFAVTGLAELDRVQP